MKIKYRINQEDGIGCMFIYTKNNHNLKKNKKCVSFKKNFIVIQTY